MMTNLRKFAKFTSVALLFSGAFVYANSCEFDDDKNCVDGKPKFFTFNGSVESFSKVGFNRVTADVTNNKYPTETYVTMHGSFDTQFNILSFLSTDYISKFEIGLGAAATGMVYDSTLNDGIKFNGSGLTSGSGMNNNYVGYWAGFLGNGVNGSSGGYKDSRYFVFKNAYVDLQTKYVNFKGGRYESNMDYHSAYTQGFNIDTRFSFGDTDARPDNEVKVWWFSSFGRAFAYAQWVYDFYAVKTTDTNGDGKADVTYGIHAAGVDLTYGGFSVNEESGYRYGDSIMVRPFIYFYPGIFESMGMKAVYEHQLGNGFGFKVTAQGYALHVNPSKTSAAGASDRYDQKIDEWSGNINLIAQANMFNYNVRVGYYQNIKAANSHFGTYGNPMGLDFWTAGVYDMGPSMNDIVSRNAATVYTSGGGYHNLNFATFSWDVLARLTRSPRSNEESIALTLNLNFNNGFFLGTKLEWLRDTTHAGYKLGSPAGVAGGAIAGSTQALSASRTDDRSHAYFMLGYNF